MTNSKEKNELALKELKYFLNEYNNKQISIYELMENIMALYRYRYPFDVMKFEEGVINALAIDIEITLEKRKQKLQEGIDEKLYFEIDPKTRGIVIRVGEDIIFQDIKTSGKELCFSDTGKTGLCEMQMEIWPYVDNTRLDTIALPMTPNVMVIGKDKVIKNLNENKTYMDIIAEMKKNPQSDFHSGLITQIISKGTDQNLPSPVYSYVEYCDDLVYLVADIRPREYISVYSMKEEGYEKSAYIIKSISWNEPIAELYKEELKLAKEHHHNYALLDNILLKYRIQEKKKILLPRKATDKQY